MCDKVMCDKVQTKMQAAKTDSNQAAIVAMLRAGEVIEVSAITLLQGDCLQVLATLPDESVHTCVTSPPYFGLRDYGTATWDGGDDGCDHKKPASAASKASTTLIGTHDQDGYSAYGVYRDQCGKCGARRIDSQIGLEETPDAYVAKMVEVFREVRRVLRGDGTLWLNLGDSYSGSGKGPAGNIAKGKASGEARHLEQKSGGIVPDGLKPKDLIGIPWRVAFALQADGWYLRQDIIWHKPNPMPESVTDRCTKSHEYIFLLSKKPTYYYDADAIKEPSTNQQGASARFYRPSGSRQAKDGRNSQSGHEAMLVERQDDGKRNRRSVWTVTTKPYKGAHFATFPPDLIEPCILAGAPQRCCSECGAPWVRVVEKSPAVRNAPISERDKSYDAIGDNGNKGMSGGKDYYENPSTSTTTGWQPTCTCDAGVIGGVVLDPFNGAGTTGVVAIQHSRRYIGIELNPDYLEMSRKRIQAKRNSLTMPMFDASHAFGADAFGEVN